MFTTKRTRVRSQLVFKRSETFGALFLFPAVACRTKMCYIYLIGVMLMRILGVDPGIATVGFAVLDAEKRSSGC